jgi:hypothetical protein
MSASLTTEEWMIVNDLVRAGVSAPSATLAIVMATREHSRPQTELADVVRQYQNLDSRTAAEQAIQDLLRRDWLSESESYGQYLIKQAPNLRQLIADALGNTSVGDKLLDLRASHEKGIRIVGSMNDELVYSSYLDLLRGAQREICLPMLATSPNLSSVPILKERAAKGVRIRILLGSPALVATLRGAPMKSVAADAIAGWEKHAKESKAIQIRIVHKPEHALLATCMLVDDTILRLDVYDPYNERSLQGVMVEFQSQPGARLNVIFWFREWFETAWRASQPTGRFGLLRWRLGRNWQLWVFCVFAVLAGTLSKSFWSGIFGSAAATFMIASLGDFARWWRHKFGHTNGN